MQLEVQFDHRDREYHMGEQISGDIVVEADRYTGIGDVWLTYRWRTHGNGTRDQGLEHRLLLAGQPTVLQAGERRRVPFQFDCPDGPVTYHGRYINVDWYLTAHARDGRGRDLKTEEDFLLLPGEPKGDMQLGTLFVPLEDVPARPQSGQPEMMEFGIPAALPPSPPPRSPSKIPAFLRTIFSVALTLAAIAGLLSVHFLFDLVPIGTLILGVAALLSVAIGLGAILSNAYKRKLQLDELMVEPQNIRPGGRVKCRLALRVRREVFLKSIRASIYAQEAASSQQGTTTVTMTYRFGEKMHVRNYDEQLTEGRQISFQCLLPVDAEAPATFKAGNNSLGWCADVKVELKGWPGITRTFPITVLP